MLPKSLSFKRPSSTNSSTLMSAAKTAATATIKPPSTHPVLATKYKVGLMEHRLSADSSPMVALALTLPAGSNYSVSEGEFGQVSAYFKHLILQGSRGESKISVARKADLRPSPIGVAQSRDLLTLHAQFHVNYLPDILETFRSLTASSNWDFFSDYSLQTEVKQAVELDSALAAQNPLNLLLDAAHWAHFRQNYLNPTREALEMPVSLEDLRDFAHAAAQRSSGHSLLLSVNDASVIKLEQFKSLVSSSRFPIDEGSGLLNVADQEANATNPAPRRIHFEAYGADEGLRALLTYPVAEGGFAQGSFVNFLHMVALLKRQQKALHLPEIVSSVTATTALIGFDFRFPDFSTQATEISNSIQETQKTLKLFTNQKQEDWLQAREAANIAYQTSLDSRLQRLLTFSHQLALLGKTLPVLPCSDEKSNNNKMMKETFELMEPVLITRGPPKKFS